MSDDDPETAQPHLPSVKLWPMMLVALLALCGVGAGARQFWGQPPVRYAKIMPAAAGSGDLAPLIAQFGQVPAVEPLLLRPVTSDYARIQNAAMPFTSKPVPPAPPFAFSGGQTDLSRAVDCLAATIFYEAGNETIEGQKAVVQVVLNRARHPAFPKSVCGVVFQGEERSTGCQFSYTCDGSLARKPSDEQWERFRAIGQAMLAGEVYLPVGSATHYHTDWVLPSWSPKLEKIRAEGTHLFFRWPGFWGSPKALRGGLIGVEPIIPKMAALSPAHRGVGTGLQDLDLSELVIAEMALPEFSNMVALPEIAPVATVSIDRNQSQFIINVGASEDPTQMLATAAQMCGERAYCKVMGWSDRASTPPSFPVPEANLASLSFSYLRNRDTGFDKALWNCKQFDRADTSQCMRGTFKPKMTQSGKPKLVKPPIIVEPMPSELAPAANAVEPANTSD